MYTEISTAGKRIKKIRAKQGLTLRNLARKAELTAASISMIENGKTSPTLATLHKILVALGTGFGDFFSDDRTHIEGFHFPGKKMKKIATRKTEYTLLLPRRNDIKTQMVFERLSPGEKAETETHKFDVAGFILKGGPLKLEVVDKGERLIRKGDAFYISAGSPHRSMNIGKGVLEMITCYYPPRY